MAARGVMLVTIGMAIVIGVLEYHRVLDPPRAERDGFAMNLLVDRGNATVPNDWYAAGAAHIDSTGRALRIVAEADGWVLESRIVHLLADDCYRVQVSGNVTRGAAVFAAFDAELTRFGAYTPLPATSGRASFLVSTPDERVTFAVVATNGAHITLAGIQIRRLPRRCTTPRTGRDIVRVLDHILGA